MSRVFSPEKSQESAVVGLHNERASKLQVNSINHISSSAQSKTQNKLQTGVELEYLYENSNPRVAAAAGCVELLMGCGRSGWRKE